jgi:hypothetical protein
MRCGSIAARSSTASSQGFSLARPRSRPMLAEGRSATATTSPRSRRSHAPSPSASAHSSARTVGRTSPVFTVTPRTATSSTRCLSTVASPSELRRPPDPGEHAFLVEYGTAAIELPRKGRRAQRLAIAQAGDIFGEVHALEGRRYDASLRGSDADGAVPAAAREAVAQLELGPAASLLERFDVVQRQLEAIARRRERRGRHR